MPSLGISFHILEKNLIPGVAYSSTGREFCLRSPVPSDNHSAESSRKPTSPTELHQRRRLVANQCQHKCLCSFNTHFYRTDCLQSSIALAGQTAELANLQQHTAKRHLLQRQEAVTTPKLAKAKVIPIHQLMHHNSKPLNLKS